MNRRWTAALIGVALTLWALPGCNGGLQPLMPTPLLFTQGETGPLFHVPQKERWTPRRVYYATDRKRVSNQEEISYSNSPSDTVSVGLSVIRFGDRDMTWEELEQASRSRPRDHVIELNHDGILEVGEFPRGARPDVSALPNKTGWFIEDLNDSIADARDKDILIYVHGAKVGFYNGCAFAAQLDHFMGRDMTSIAFCWPTRQNLVAYALGSDKGRAYTSAESLASLIELLADASDVRYINILCWSAGGRVTTEAIRLLRERSPDEPIKALRRRLRLGTVYYAAADVPVKEFMLSIGTINSLVQSFIVTMSRNDGALKAASAMMGGGARIGMFSENMSAEQIERLNEMDRLTVIDMSAGSEARGFDITGHRYWFDHPWSSSDVILAIRSDFEPQERGLQQHEYPWYWVLPDDYPQRIEGILEKEWRRE